MNGVREVLVVAGEASGDLHAAGVLAALHRIRPELRIAAVGGSRMQREGAIGQHQDHAQDGLQAYGR